MSERRKLEEGKDWAGDASEHTDAEIAAITVLPCNQGWIASNTHVYFGLHLLVSLLGNLEVSLLHIRTLLRVERVSDGAENKDIQLDSLLPLLLLFFVLGLKCSLYMYISESSFWRTNKNRS